MAEGLENLRTILHDWAKDKVQKILSALNSTRSRAKKDKDVSFLEMTQKNTRAVSISSHARLDQAQNWSR